MLKDVTTIINFYLIHMSRQTEPVKRIFYADDDNRMSFGSQDSGTGTQDQQLPDRDVPFPTR